MIKSNWKIFYQNFVEKMVSEDGFECYPEMNYQVMMGYADSEQNKGFGKVPLMIEQMEI
jgi:uncharacterized membrane protein